jgi:hypothetical protein
MVYEARRLARIHSFRALQSRRRRVALHAEQLGEIFDPPLIVSLQYAGQKSGDVRMALSVRKTDLRVPLAGTLGGIDVSEDDGTLAEIVQ